VPTREAENLEYSGNLALDGVGAGTREAMKQNHVLIDYENVQPDVASALAQSVFKVWVFVGAQQAKVKFDLLHLVQQKGQDARVIKMTSTGRNALDFHMSCYLGQLMTNEPDGYFHIVAKDTGMDPLLDHLREKGIKVWRWVDVFEIPIVKGRSDEPDEDKLSRIIEYLVRRGKQRPATMKTLLGSTAALFNPKLEEPESVALIERLRANGVFQVVGTKLQYGLPEQ